MVLGYGRVTSAQSFFFSLKMASSNRSKNSIDSLMIDGTISTK
jgi:hypothetical protein